MLNLQSTALSALIHSTHIHTKLFGLTFYRSVLEVTTDAVASVVETVTANPYVLNMSLALLLVSFIVELYPSVPRHNTSLAAACLWVASNSKM